MQKFIKKENNSVKLLVDSKVYSLSTIYSAGYVFLDRAYVYLDKDNKGKIIVWLFPKNKKENLDKLGMEFYNELLNYAHYFSSLKVNNDVLKTLIQRALFSTSPSLVQEAEEKEIQDLVKELEEEEKKETNKKATSKKK
ncbi:MAG: hypothetical protein ISS47_05850 [Candidatus Omnitrophica bacterium]|nr:hypothetical protein [Candidatus Omnitrophota bacterium]